MSEEEKFDPAELAKELDANSSTDENENAAETEAAQTREETAESEPEKGEEVKTQDGEEDDERFLESNNGKAIPFPAFQKKYTKWKSRTAEKEAEAAKIRSEFEAYKKSAPAPEQVQRLEALTKVFGNLDQAAKQNPWLTDVLLALGRGEQPNWHNFAKALDEHVKALPTTDPLLIQQIKQLEARQESFEHERFVSSVESHLSKENEEIRKLIGDDESLWKILNDQASSMVPEKGDIKDLPNRVEMAKRIMTWADSFHQKKLKAQIPPANRTKPDLHAGKGLPATAKTTDEDEVPKIGTEEWIAWMAKAM